ncbi:MAG: matrixin family metalloprotease [Bryobacterales bacterium]|nr:matrixin family metalloprotease [Bryobacterales bacterium]
MRCFGAVLAALLVLAPGASGYYFFVEYLSRSEPFAPVYWKFDLNALTNKTVPVLISSEGPTAQASGDSFAALVSQIQAAARAWNDVPSSALRVSFGGFFTPGTTQSAPAIEVVFDDLPPGVVALGGPTRPLQRPDIVPSESGPFIPIIRSTVVLGRDLSNRASWSEAFFLSLVHEFGHTFGLQHSLTSSVMSTEVTRATTKARPLASDDIAGISLLYPVAGAASGGVIQGRVTMSGVGIGMASVVAISMDGATVSALTNPDGTYRIQGIPGGLYYVYAHPIPPAISGEAFPAGISPPTDFPAGPSFETVFYPGTKDLLAAAPLALGAGEVVEGLNFAVTRRNAPAVFGVTTYSYPGQVAVKPAHLTVEGSRNFLVATGYGLTASTAVQVLGGSVTVPPGGVRPYSLDPRYIQLDLQFSLLSGEGSRHLVFTADNDLYVLPSGFRLTRRLPPQITGLVVGTDASGNPLVTLSGSGLGLGSQVLFDGISSAVRSADESAGTITVVPPSGSVGQRSAVVVLNGDGQSSLFMQSSSAVSFYEHQGGDVGSLVVSPQQIAAGTEEMVEIQTTGSPLTANALSATFGSSGLAVRRVWLAGPNRVLANVIASPSTLPGATTVSLLNGLRMSVQPGGFVVVAGGSRPSSFRGPVVDGTSGRVDIPVGGLAQATLTGPITEVPANGLTVTVNDRPAQIVSWTGGVLTFTVPAGLTPGVAVLRVTTPGIESPRPIAMGIDIPPPAVVSVQVSGTRVDAARPAQPGELLSVVVSGLGDPGQEIATSRVTVQVGALQHRAAQVTAQQGGNHVVQFILDQGVPPGSQILTVNVDGRVSAGFTLPVRAN